MSPTSIHNWLTNLHTAIGRYRSVASSNSNSNQITSNDPLNRVSFSLPSFEPFSIPFFKLKLSTVSLSLFLFVCVVDDAHLHIHIGPLDVNRFIASSSECDVIYVFPICEMKWRHEMHGSVCAQCVAHAHRKKRPNSKPPKKSVACVSGVMSLVVIHGCVFYSFHRFKNYEKKRYKLST